MTTWVIPRMEKQRRIKRSLRHMALADRAYATRIQSFPDSFRFFSGLRETERQIGNAVPPVLAWHVARAVAAILREDSFSHD